MVDLSVRQAAEAINQADGLVIAAGAGMGVDSGLPDFRGSEGFWRAYPALGRAGLSFSEIACPQSFRNCPRLAWGFYGHRLELYRQTSPHKGFSMLRKWAQRMKHGGFVFTSNVDGQVQKAGFAENLVHECHGSIHYLQCLDACVGEIWSAESFVPTIDEARCEIVSDVPTCPGCGGIARPNLLMFGDGDWISERYDRQRLTLSAWLNLVQCPVIIEIGAGNAIPTVRRFCERLNAPLLRINRDDADLPAGRNGVGLPMTALEALSAIASALPTQKE